MPRTVIRLSDTDKRWLIQKAKAEHVPMTEIIRRALAHYRQQSSEPAELALNELLERTRGLWLKGDGARLSGAASK